MREDDRRKAAYYNECVASALGATIAVPALLTANCGSREGKPSRGANPLQLLWAKSPRSCFTGKSFGPQGGEHLVIPAAAVCSRST